MSQEGNGNIEWYKKTIIGMSGGLCLALVKLTDLQGESSLPIAGMLLGGISSIGIAAIFTTFIDENNHRKLFMNSLLAPSLVIAMASQNPMAVAGPSTESQAGSIPSLDIGNSELQAPADDRFVVVGIVRTVGYQLPRQVQTLDRSSVNGSILAGARKYYNRARPSEEHIWTIGKTTDLEKARSLADRLSEILGDDEAVQLIRPEGGDEIYITIRPFQTAADAKATKERYLGMIQGQDWGAYSLLRAGPVVESKALFVGSGGGSDTM